MSALAGWRQSNIKFSGTLRDLKVCMSNFSVFYNFNFFFDRLYRTDHFFYSLSKTGVVISLSSEIQEEFQKTEKMIY